MKHFKKTILPILLTGLWINISETVRWILIIKSYWIEHYQSLNLVFPDEPINGLIWLIWGFLFAIVVFILSKKFNLIQTTLLSWFVVFVMLWVAIWSIGVFPLVILWYNIPLSLLEAFVSALICRRLINK